MHFKLDFLTSKIIRDRIELDKSLAIWKSLNKKIVFTNGCFDIIHRGHIEYLVKAAAYGDYLIIGLNSDDSVRRIKGNDRPVQDQESRALVLAAFHFVDRVVIFNEDTPYELIKQVKPQVLIKGGDYRPNEIVGYDIVKVNGGKVVVIDFIDGYSTSSIIEKLKK